MHLEIFQKMPAQVAKKSTAKQMTFLKPNTRGNVAGYDETNLIIDEDLRVREEELDDVLDKKGRKIWKVCF